MRLVDREPSVDSNLRHNRAIRDRLLVSEAQGGSSAAFTELFTSYKRQLYSAVFAITKNREDAEDALQDTFMRAFIAIQRFEGRSTVYSWLTRIAINSSFDDSSQTPLPRGGTVRDLLGRRETRSFANYQGHGPRPRASMRSQTTAQCTVARGSEVGAAAAPPH